MARRHNWNLISYLYLNGYSSGELGAIFSTSPGTISRGLQGKVMLRKSGLVVMALAPNQFPADINKVLKEEGLFEVVPEYYNYVLKVKKASIILRYKGKGYTNKQIADHFNIGETQIYLLLKIPEVEALKSPKAQSKLNGLGKNAKFEKMASILGAEARKRHAKYIEK